MTFCGQCGHQLGVGRFCTNCGHPVTAGEAKDSSGTPPVGDAGYQPAFDPTWRTDTAERSAVRARPPLLDPRPPTPARGIPALTDLPDAPSNARFPLFADEVEPPGAAGPALPAGRSAGVPGDVGAGDGGDRDDRGRTGRGGLPPWAVVGLVGLAGIVVVTAVGLRLVTGDTDSAGDGPERAPGASASAPASTGTPSAGADATAPSAPADTPTATPTGRAVRLGAGARVRVPATTPPGESVTGERVSFAAANLLDRDTATCWRRAGDGTGDTLVVTLATESLVTRVGLVNGYAKTDTDDRGRTYDWYDRNRRVLAVEWTFDDGTTLRQDLRTTPRMQTVAVPGGGALTGTVRLRLLQVSAPGRRAGVEGYGRDNTALSELDLVGVPA